MTVAMPLSKPTGGCRPLRGAPVGLNASSCPRNLARLLSHAGVGRSLDGAGPGHAGWQGAPCTHSVALRVGQDGVLGRQGNAAGRDHQEDTHLEVAQVHDVVAGPADPAGQVTR